MVKNYQKVTDEPTQVTYENGSTVVSIFKRNNEWRVKAKQMTDALSIGGGDREEFVGRFPNRELAVQGAKTWMRNNPNGLGGNDFGFDMGGSGDFGFDLNGGNDGLL